MSTSDLRTLFNKRVTAIFFLIAFCLTEKGFSRNHWSRDDISVTYNQSQNDITIKIPFIDYEFGPMGEHAYFEQLTVSFCFHSSESYQELMRAQVNDQIYKDTSEIYMTPKFRNATFKFYDCIYPEDGTVWKENTDLMAFSKNISKKASVTVVWDLPADVIISSILITGKWHVDGLFCGDDIIGEVYNLTDNSTENPNKKTTLLQQGTSHPENNNVSVYKERDAVVVKGIEQGTNVRVYTTTGALVKSMNVNRDLVQIKLPPNQLYTIHVAHASYRVLL